MDDERAGLCCVVSAIKGAVKKEDFECVSFDEVRDGEPTVAAGEKIASSVVSITSKVGEINLEVSQLYL